MCTSEQAPVISPPRDLYYQYAATNTQSRYTEESTKIPRRRTSREGKYNFLISIYSLKQPVCWEQQFFGKTVIMKTMVLCTFHRCCSILHILTGYFQSQILSGRNAVELITCSKINKSNKASRLEALQPLNVLLPFLGNLSKIAYKDSKGKGRWWLFLNLGQTTYTCVCS